MNNQSESTEVTNDELLKVLDKHKVAVRISAKQPSRKNIDKLHRSLVVMANLYNYAVLFLTSPDSKLDEKMVRLVDVYNSKRRMHGVLDIWPVNQWPNFENDDIPFIDKAQAIVNAVAKAEAVLVLKKIYDVINNERSVIDKLREFQNYEYDVICSKSFDPSARGIGVMPTTHAKYVLLKTQLEKLKSQIAIDKRLISAILAIDLPD